MAWLTRASRKLSSSIIQSTIGSLRRSGNPLSGRLLENMIGYLGFSGRRRIYRQRGDSRRRRRAPGGPQARPRVGPRLEGFWRLGASPGVLRVPSLFQLGNKSRKFSARSEKLHRTTFLKQKDSRKQELALGILLIG